jgi:hypothetical protein
LEKEPAEVDSNISLRSLDASLAFVGLGQVIKGDLKRTRY